MLPRCFPASVYCLFIENSRCLFRTSEGCCYMLFWYKIRVRNSLQISCLFLLLGKKFSIYVFEAQDTSRSGWGSVLLCATKSYHLLHDFQLLLMNMVNKLKEKPFEEIQIFKIFCVGHFCFSVLFLLKILVAI